jgi:hypothetical protein
MAGASPIYVTHLDVQAMTKNLVGPSTNPNLNAVGSIIARVAVEVEAAAAVAGYAVPIPTSATQAYAQMSQYVLQGVLWQTWRGLIPQMGGDNDKNLSANEYRDSYQAALQQLRDGELPLIGAPTDPSDVSRVLPRSFQTSNAGATQSGACPAVRVGMQF